MIPSIHSQYTAQEIVNILWEYNIGKATYIKLTSSSDHLSKNKAYLSFIEINPIIYSLLENGKFFSIQIEEHEIWVLRKYSEEDIIKINNQEKRVSTICFPSKYFEKKQINEQHNTSSTGI